MSQVNLAYYVPNFEVQISGASEQTLNSLRQHIQGITITEQLQSPAEFSFVLTDEFDIKSQRFRWLDDKFLQPGQEKISIKIGYVKNMGKDGTMVEIIKDGKIKKLESSGFSQDTAPTINVTGYDATHTILTKSPEIKDESTSIELTGSKVVEIVTKDSGFISEVESTTEYPTKITKGSETNYIAILKERAESIAFEFFPSRHKFYFKNLRKNKSPDHVYEWGRDIVEFVPRINTSDLYTGVKVISMTDDSKKEIKGEAKAGEEDTIEDGDSASKLAEKMFSVKVKEIHDKNYSSPEEAKTKAIATLNILGDKLITGDGSVVGNPKIEIGQIMELRKLGRQFSGLYIIEKVSHEFSQSGYITKFSLRKNVMRKEYLESVR